jgi:DNA-3-methyladenine glycosylase
LTAPPDDRVHEASTVLARDTAEAARLLLGWFVVASSPDGTATGRIVETEAYLGADDPASHAAMFRTERVAIMAGRPGLAYVYRSYGVHAMLNVVAHRPGAVGAVLVRALEPWAGLDLMAARRGNADPRALCSGPGKLCRALAITLDHHGTDLLADGSLRLEPGPPPAAIDHGGRIGISRAVEAPLRFWEAGSPFVSAHRRGARWPAESVVGAERP